MSVFQPVTIVTDDKAFIALKHIESINFFREDEEAVVEKLKDDIKIKIRTTSGIYYTISMQMQKSIYGASHNIPADLKILRDAIYARWVNLIS